MHQQDTTLQRTIGQRLLSIFDMRSLFFRIASFVGGAGLFLSVSMTALYYQQLTDKGLQNASAMQVEMQHMFSTQIVQDINRNVTRRIGISLNALNGRVADVFVYGAVFDREGVLLSEHHAADLTTDEGGANEGDSSAVVHEPFQGFSNGLLETQFAIIRETLEPIVLADLQTVIAPSILPTGKLAGFTLSVWDADAIRTPIKRLAFFAACFLIAVFLVWTVLVVSILGRMVGRPLKSISSALADLEAKKYDISRHDFGSVSEMKVIKKRFYALEAVLVAGADAQRERDADHTLKSAAIERLSISLDALARRDLSERIEEPFTGQYDVLRQNFNTAQHEMGLTLRNISDTCVLFDEEIGHLVGASTDLAGRSSRQAQTLSGIISSLSDASERTGMAVQSAQSVRSTVMTTNKTVEKSGEVVTAAVTAMAEIETSSSEIQKIIGVIEDIAFQTNLLALNAAVEASRAGDAGRGFSVVAAEVRNLSTRTTEAAREIQDLISSSVHQVKTGVNLVRDVGTSLNVAIDGVKLIDTEVNGLVDTFISYSETLEALNGGAAKLDQATQKSAAMADDMKTSTDHLRARAIDLQEFVALFALPHAGREMASPRFAA